ncbi:MAG: hypothetical protein PF638_15390 [Candidatus Delongbacteria bacterium]|jgi:hypothetical protein|nr:hypothetical protein [Candidatus Delongbacteria bacterium]
MNYKLVRIVQNQSDEEWKEYFEFRTKYATISNENLKTKTWNELKESSLKYMEQGNGIYTIYKDRYEAGYFMLDKFFKNHPELKHIYIYHYFVDKFIDNDLIKLVLQSFLEFHSDHGFLVIPSKNGAHDYIGEMLNIEMCADQIQYELIKENVKNEVLEEWIQTYSAKFPNLRMKFYEKIPKELVEEYCRILTVLMLDMPANTEVVDPYIIPETFLIDEEKGRKENHTSYRYLIFNEANKLIAMTQVAIDKNDLSSICQHMTGVINNYRNLGIGKWMKGAMYKKLEKDFPDFEKITTQTHRENHSAKSICEQMGFKQTAIYKEFKVTREKASSQ